MCGNVPQWKINLVKMSRVCCVNLTEYTLESLFTEEQLKNIVRQNFGGEVKIEKWILAKASEGLAGFLGDHLRLTLIVGVDGTKKDMKLFVKCLPNYNQPKVDFLRSNLFYKREVFVLNELLKDCRGFEGSDMWRPRVYLCTEEILVMDDLEVQGFKIHDKSKYFDLDHCRLALTALAKFHSASVNYETEKCIQSGHDYRLTDEYSDLLEEINFTDNQWFRTGLRATSVFLDTYSKIYNSSTVNINASNSKLETAFIKAIESVNSLQDTFSVVIHKDLWCNNFMFRLKSRTPMSAVILDFQCVRYAPPAFDVSSFLYLNTSKAFRDLYERTLLHHYYTSFMKHLTNSSVSRIKNYSFQRFLQIFEASRMFGLIIPVLIFPYILMDPVSAKTHFDDEDTYELYGNVDRTDLIVNFAEQDEMYRDRILEVTEELMRLVLLEN